MAKAPADIRSKARQHTDTAVAVLVEIMLDRNAPHQARVDAATQIINRDLGPLDSPQEFAPVERQFYVYSIHGSAGRLVYIGKGQGRRSHVSGRRLAGKPRIRAWFDAEHAALAYEFRLIARFRPPMNIVGKPPENRAVSGGG